MAGPALGGFLIAKFGMASTYTIDFATYLISLIALAAIRSMPAPEGRLRTYSATASGARSPVSDHPGCRAARHSARTE
ncbi:hypothetical protein B4Q13_21385 [Lacticaseibacillus rhamnosus]